MENIIILAMHGIVPNDYPKRELAEFFKLYAMVESMGSSVPAHIQSQYLILEKQMRNWPRNEQNDPFHMASCELATKLSKVSGQKVIVGYNEFCSPSLVEALVSAVQDNPDRIIVVTTMMTSGGDHSEKDIPLKINEFKKLYPNIEIVYAWPFDSDKVAHFLGEHISQFSSRR